ncbi:major facilitator superfamily transporter [Truncatella angustata]|uniref:Major facilitator superfamily transporter n=1 Tax=Truncatella angustata TaxID=152316 RepID=A0A9P8UYL9_9PEZI|nr:major facilitator superfamily transporter [Truncatella angustata]KAH6660956.1 major facilitator superfamily transporter [Truncatella angustata]
MVSAIEKSGANVPDGGAEGKRLSVEEKGDVVELASSYTEEEERRVLRKIDYTILPMMCFIFFLQYLDKQTLSYASVFGLITDLGMSSTQYSWCTSIFYIGQLVAEYPFIYLMSKLHLTKFVGVTVVIWGIICMCLAAPHSFAGFAAVRFLLGFAEGAVSPSFVTITAIWYQKDEHAVRTALWVTMNGIAQVIGCLLMYGIGKNNTLSLAPWRTIFIVCGAITTAAGGAFYLMMPNGPKDAWFLNAREKEVLSARMAKDREGGDKTSFSVRQLREALLDGKSWFVLGFGVLVTMQSPVLTFASLVINTIGYDKYQTMLYTAPSGAVQVLLLWIGVAGCWLFPRNRTLVVLVLIIPPLIGTVLLLKLSTDSGWGMIIASWLASCITAVMSPLLSLTASNVKGNTKRSVVSAMFFIGYCAGCIGAPQLWTDKPRYFKGVVTGIVTWCLLFIVVAAYRFVCIRDNAARDKCAAAHQHVDGVATHTQVVLDKYGAPRTDLTDKEDARFRYSW